MFYQTANEEPTKRGLRSRTAMWALAFFGGAAAIPTASALFSQDGQVAGAAQVRSVLDILAMRSPGERTTGHLSKSKSEGRVPKLVLPAGGGPKQRGLGKVFPFPPVAPPMREEPPVVTLGDGPVEFDFSGGPFIPSDLAPYGNLSAPGGIVGGFVAGGAPGGGVSPGGASGGGPGAGGSNGDTGTSPPAVSAVPEPSTWTMMLLGFGLIGAGMRRKKLTTAKPKPNTTIDPKRAVLSTSPPQ